MNKGNGLPILSNLSCNEIHLGLGPIKRLLGVIGNPQFMYPTVLIGGTNGKGSIAAFLSSIIRESGYKVGLYTSPHLISICERIRINDSLISEERIDECIRFISSHLKESLTYFEYLTASAFLYFYQEKVDIAVLEVGMGGRLDATNIVKPILSVISNIHRDHQEYLGRYLKHIAYEKAAIIKDNSICITAVSQKEIINILEDTCRRKGANLLRLGKDIHVRLKRDRHFSYQGPGLKIANLYSSLSGAHQIKNAALALAAAELITAKGVKLTKEAMITGVANATWEGRLEILQKMPTVIVDGAHNLSAITVLCDELRQWDSFTSHILIFGVLLDKNYRLMFKKLLPFFQHIIFTRPKTERAVDVDTLTNMAKQYGHFAEAIEDCREALKRALSLAGNKDLICATGSLYLVGEIKKIYAEGIF